tara:strand:- start:2940 stop:3773 length:834 start_codon:yes stop_codon:yes gene_type:complete
MDKILITGAAGFIGHKLFNHLKTRYNVLGVDFNLKEKLNDKIVIIDLLREKNISKLLDSFDPDFVFHLAAYAGPPRNEKNPEFAYKYNVDILKSLLKSLNKNTKIFFPSTDKIFEGNIYPDETTVLNPPSVHGKLKLICEDLIKNFTSKYFIFRQPVIHSYGNYKQLSEMSGCSFIDKAIDDINKKRNIKIFDNVKRCFVKVEELVFVYEKLINSENFGIYNIASPLKSYHRRLIDICNERKINFEKYVTKTQGSTYPLEQDINSQKFEKVFNFKFT